MARFVLHLENLDKLDTESIMRKVADDIADDARRLAPKDDGQLRASIRVSEVSARHAVIVADPRNPESSPEHAAYAAHVERGTSDTRAVRFMSRAGRRYRTP